MIRKLICRLRGHKWCDWFTVVVNCNDDGSFQYEDWRDCKRCGKHDEKQSEQKPYTEETCPDHVASQNNPKVCGRCGVHIDSFRPQEIEL